MAQRHDDWTELKELSMSVRLANCLENDRLRWIWQVRRIPDAELMRIPNFGRRSLKELRWFASYELKDGETEYKEYGEERQKLYELVIEPTDWIDILAGKEGTDGAGQAKDA
jgi:DNA-directed RNA polymerase alpha subunit